MSYIDGMQPIKHRPNKEIVWRSDDLICYNLFWQSRNRYSMKTLFTAGFQEYNVRAGDQDYLTMHT